MLKPIDRYKAVFFDAGDTLLTIPQAHTLIKAYLSARSIERDEEPIRRVLNEAIRIYYYERDPEQYEACTPESDRRFWVELYTYMLEKLGALEHWDEGQIHRCCHELYDIFTGPDHYRLFDDVKPCLRELSGRGLRLGLISNFAPTLREILRVNDILHYFDPLIVSTEAGLEKPDPAIFLLALEQSGLSADQVLYVGDHQINDILAASKAGIDAVRIRRYSYLEGDGIHSLEELYHRKGLER